MSGFLFSKKPVSNAELIIDIGSKSVGGGIFEKNSKGGAKLLYTIREPIEFQTQLTGDNLLASVMISLNKLLLHLEKYAISHLKTPYGKKYRIHSANIIISSPWHSSETKILRLNFVKPAAITKSFIRKILDREEKSFESQLESSDKAKNDFCLLERKIIEMRLNGYPTSKPYGKEASSLEVRMFNSLISVKILEKIESMVTRHFHIENILFHTFSAAAFASIRDSFPAIEDFSIIQIGGEVTDVVIVKKGNIAETISFPFGHNSLLRVLEKTCSNHPRCSLEALITLHSKSGVTAKDKSKVEKAINDTRNLWLEHLNEAVSNFSQEAFLPNVVFLFEDSPYSSLFEKSLREAVPGKLTINSRPFAVVAASQETMKGAGGIGGEFWSDPILSMEAGFSASLGRQNFLSS